MVRINVMGQEMLPSKPGNHGMRQAQPSDRFHHIRELDGTRTLSARDRKKVASAQRLRQRKD